MNNADKFKKTFGIYATELWAMPESEFLKWLNAECADAVEVVRCRYCKYFDGDCCDRYADETLGYSHSTQPNFFCAVGERKINDS